MSKDEILNEYWVENSHLGLKELDDNEAKSIIDSMDEEYINMRINHRKFQEDYIADYLEYLWEISEVSFWKHVDKIFNHEQGLLVSDNMFYHEMLCSEKISTNLLITIINYLSAYDRDEVDNEFDLLSDIINSQIEKYNRLNEIKNIISSLPDLNKKTAEKRLNELMN